MQLSEMFGAGRAIIPPGERQAAGWLSRSRRIGDDPLSLDMPPLHPKQQQAEASPATEMLYGGAGGGGKSHFLRVRAIRLALQAPGLLVYLFRRKFEELNKSHMEGPASFPALLAPLVDSGHARIVYSAPQSIRFSNGSRIFLSHCLHEKNKYDYNSAEMHVLLIDELTHFTESIYRYLRSRVRLGGLVLPPGMQGLIPLIIGASNPGNIGHQWVKRAFLTPRPEGEVWRTEKREGGMLRQFLRARLGDNPTMTEADPAYEQRLDGLGSPALVRAIKEGDWNIVAGGMFDDVWDEGAHSIDPFDIPPSWRVDRSFDWGSSTPFSCGWWAESDGSDAPDGTVYPRGTLFRIAEWYGARPDADNEGLRMTVEEVAEGIKARQRGGMPGFRVLEGLYVRPGPADASIFNVVEDQSYADRFAAAGAPWTRASNAGGSREAGWLQMRKLMKASLQSPMEQPGIFIFNTCRAFVETVPVLPRSEVKPEDVLKGGEDHIADEARYRVTGRPALRVMPRTGGAKGTRWM